MTQVTLSKKGIGPFEYNGYQYYVAPASKRMKSRWPGNSVVINGKTWDIPTNDELNNIIYGNRKVIDELDITISESDSPLLANIGTATARENGNSRPTNTVWSSTVHSSSYVWTQRFADGCINIDAKDNEFWIVGIYKEPIGVSKDQSKQLTFEHIEEVTIPSPKSEAALKLMRNLATSDDFNSLDMDSKNQILDILEVLIKEK